MENLKIVEQNDLWVDITRIRVTQCNVEFTDLIASSELLQFERGATHALNTSRKETYLRLGAINNLQ